MAQIRAVCFDIGGVLAHVAYTWDEAMAAAGLPADPKMGTPLDNIPAFLLYQAGQLDIEAYLDELGDLLGVDAAAALRVHESILLGPTAGTLEIVQELNARGLVTGCLSNTNTLHWGVLIDPDRYPSVAALKVKGASQLIGHNKPAEASYRAFEELAATASDQILFFEDGPANVAGAKACGWNAILIDPTKAQAPQINRALGEFEVTPN